MQVDHISMSTTPIFLRKGEMTLSQGTGFYFVHTQPTGNTLFLVTNLHVLTGSPPQEKYSLSSDNMIFQFHESGEDVGRIKNIRYPLTTKLGNPVWVNNRNSPEADVAVIPLPAGIYEGVKVFGISPQWSEPKIKVRPSSTVTLVGYPYGFYDLKNSLPIWKTGSVASEPSVDFDGKPSFLIDVSAHPGMSGSPVFAISYGTYEQESGGTRVGGARQFLGIFASSQIIRQKKFIEEMSQSSPGIIVDHSLQLGHVWKAGLVIDTVKSVELDRYKEEIIDNL